MFNGNMCVGGNNDDLMVWVATEVYLLFPMPGQWNSLGDR